MDARSGDARSWWTILPCVYSRSPAGASLAGSFLKLLGIYVGFSIEFATGGGNHRHHASVRSTRPSCAFELAGPGSPLPLIPQSRIPNPQSLI